MSSMNCWEFKNCGRERGGANADALGVCPASTVLVCDGKNHGKNGGRYCWWIAGTLCDGVVQGSFAQKAANCKQCEFYKAVREEEGKRFCL